MRIFSFIIVLILHFSAFGQVNVSSLTPEFKGSGGLSLDPEGNLYIGDFGDFLSAGDGDNIPNDIMKLDKDLNLTSYATNFIGASGNDFNSEGVLHQSDIGSNGIYKIVDGERILVTSVGISSPVGIVFDSQDNFFVCNCGNNTIRKVTPQGENTLFASGTEFFCPNGITVDENDNLYVSNFSNGNIIKITPEGVSTVLNDTPTGVTSGASNGHLDYHQSTRTLYIASHSTNQIFSMHIDDPDFELTVIAGSGARGNSDGAALTATFSRPNGVAITPSGDSIYINSAIQVTNVPNRPLNPQVIRLITGVQGEPSVVTIPMDYTDKNVFPNPASDQLFIDATLLDHFSNLTLEVINNQGQLVEVKKMIGTVDKKVNISGDLKNLPAGIYYYKLMNAADVLVNGKFMKE